MSYLNTISRLRGDSNMGGVVALQVARAADIESIPAPIDGTVYGDIVFKEGKSWVTWHVILGSGRVTSNSRLSREGATKDNRFEFYIAKDRASIKVQLDQAEEDEFIILYKDSNGQNILYGLLTSPMRFEYDHDAGQSMSDLNRYECSFFFAGKDNRYYYAGAIAAPAGPAPAIVRFNGVAIASLAPGETLNITSDYSFNEYFTTAP